ncbi:unnamed protein product [Ilex paraguariensis]|uniref:Uncharacterized protein n=1 Tax=Ilex paraguariensis TaxID=185542 RepID=A0ABC8RX18_9AQUA
MELICVFVCPWACRMELLLIQNWLVPIQHVWPQHEQSLFSHCPQLFKTTVALLLPDVTSQLLQCSWTILLSWNAATIVPMKCMPTDKTSIKVVMTRANVVIILTIAINVVVTHLTKSPTKRNPIVNEGWVTTSEKAGREKK